MSSTTLFAVRKSQPIVEVERYGNAWGSAPFIWFALTRKYFPEANKYSVMSDPAFADKIWKLPETHKLPQHELYTLLTTWDHIIVDVKHMPEVAKSLKQFYDEFYEPEVICTLDKQAKAIQDLIENPIDDLFGVCWTQTSVVDMWYVYNEEIDDTEPFDLSKHTDYKHTLFETWLSK